LTGWLKGGHRFVLELPPEPRDEVIAELRRTSADVASPTIVRALMTLEQPMNTRQNVPKTSAIYAFMGSLLVSNGCACRQFKS
jgi:hypothetical protein